MGGRLVLAIKNVGTKEELCKARFAVQGHSDMDNNMLVLASPNLQQQTTRILIAIAAIFGFRLWSQDVSQAYLQSASHLTRDVYVKPRHGIKIRSDQLLRLLKQLYSLTDSGYYWHATLATHLEEDMGMVPLAGVLACFIKLINRKFSGTVGIYVDDTFATVDTNFEKARKVKERTFDRKSRSHDSFFCRYADHENRKQGFIESGHLRIETTHPKPGLHI